MLSTNVWPALSPSVTVQGMRTAWLLMVMPRSRSMSIRSRYCARALRSSTTPVSCSTRSASVDLPWSVCAMMQQFLMIAGAVRPDGGGALLEGTNRPSEDDVWGRVILPRGPRLTEPTALACRGDLPAPDHPRERGQGPVERAPAARPGDRVRAGVVLRLHLRTGGCRRRGAV